MSYEYVIALESIQGEDEEDTKLLVDMVRMAERYVRSYAWCIELLEGIFATGIGGVIALSLFRVRIRGFAEPTWIWVFTGNVPSVYLEKLDYNTPQSALNRYIDGLDEWILAAKAGKPLDGLIPLGIENPSPELVEMTESRARALREHILPWISTCEFS